MIRSVVIEPTIGESHGMIDMRLDYSDELNDRQKQFLKSVVTLNAGVSSVLLDESSDSGRSTSLRMKAVILSVYD